MKALVQRVKSSSVDVDRKKISEIGRGMMILLGVSLEDDDAASDYLALRCSNLRIYEDQSGKMNLSLKDVSGEALVVSQFTLYGDASSGNRPSYSQAAEPQKAERLYNRFVEKLRSEIGAEKVKTGIFGAMMDVQLVNDGPVTVMIESKKRV